MVAFALEINGLEGALKRLSKMSRLEDFQLLDALGVQGIVQTQRRIQSEKTTPEGAAWPANLEGGSILYRTGSHLFDSIDHAVTGQTVKWGSGWIGAAVHQFGAVIRPVNGKALAFTINGRKTFAKKVTIPARKWLGMSEANKCEMETTAARFIDILLKAPA